VNDALAWEIMNDHYRLLYLTSPGFRETVNWQAMTYTEMIHGSWNKTGRFAASWTEKREAYVKQQHEKGVKALERVVQSVLRERPALAAEERHRGAEAVVSPLSIEERRAFRDIMWARLNGHRQIRNNWYRRNQARLERSNEVLG
jgi:hypothetical protein